MSSPAACTSDVQHTPRPRARRAARAAGLAVACSLALIACGSDDADTVESVLSSPPVSGPVSSVSLPSRDEAGDRASAAQQALEDGDLSLMANALKLSGLAEEIEKKSSTLLAPTDDAFNALGASALADLLRDTTRLKTTIRRHVLDDAYSYDELKGMKSVKTVDGESLTVAVEGTRLVIGGATVNPAKVDQASGAAGQELVVLSIDRVLTGTR